MMQPLPTGCESDNTMKLILFRGRPGTGKTYLSNLLSTRINAPILRKDDIYDIISAVVPEHQVRNKVTYELLYAILTTNKHHQPTFILDFPFQLAEDIAALKTFCNCHHVTLKSMLVTCSDENLWNARINRRAESPVPNQLIADFEELRRRYPDLQLQPDAGELVIDTVRSAESILDKVLVFLK
jgi:tRNA uridine 5-carbamoylmethylation protein Kti12